MVTITVKELLEAVPILKEISNYDFPAVVAFKLMRIIQVIESELKNFDNARTILFQKYGETDENGNIKIEGNNNIVINKESIDEYNNDMFELLNTPIELVVTPIKINEISNMTFTPTQLVKINKFITE